MLRQEVQKSGNVNVSIFNNSGQLVEMLMNNQEAPGPKELIWNAADMKVSPGVYYLRVESAGAVDVRKIVIH